MSIAQLSSKLLQESDVIFVQQPDVIQLVPQRAQPIQPQSERESGEFFGIDADCAQHVRVDHSRPAHLYPARPFADAATRAVAFEAGVIDLRARFDEWEIRGAEARACFWAEEPMHEFFDRAFQVAERDAAIYQQSLDLVEH